MTNIQFLGGMTVSHIDLYMKRVAELESQGFMVSAWNKKGTGDVHIVFGIALDSWEAEIAAKDAVLVY